MHLNLAALVGLGFLISEMTLARLRNARRAAATRADGGSLRLLWVVIVSAIMFGVMLAVRDVGPRLPAALPWGFIGLGAFLAPRCAGGPSSGWGNFLPWMSRLRPSKP